jgi:hypothetical protein
LSSDAGEFGSAAQIEFLHRAAPTGFNCRESESQVSGDFGIGLAMGEPL